MLLSSSSMLLVLLNITAFNTSRLWILTSLCLNSKPQNCFTKVIFCFMFFYTPAHTVNNFDFTYKSHP